ncbi:MAG: hypothetical protein JXR37_28860 [Kiritimatiellae bacterium]|nr:hypothetical protein [Kiritimatiellia bacterium]
MPVFLDETERKAVKAHPAATRYLRALVQRVARRAKWPGLVGPDTTVEWWHCAAEYLTDAAMAQALAPEPGVATWLRDAALSVARRGEDEWIGPPFRDHGEPKCGHLETAHLAWAVAVVLDLAGDIFPAAEQEELRAALRQHGMPLCLEWLRRSSSLTNWRCILTAGLAVPAAVLGDAEHLAAAKRQFAVCTQAFQPDGSYGESLQYGGYALSITASGCCAIRATPATGACSAPPTSLRACTTPARSKRRFRPTANQPAPCRERTCWSSPRTWRRES